VLGGSSSINAMVYLRGHRNDFDGWAAAGATGWDYEGVLPYFKKMETVEGGDPEYRGTSGPMRPKSPRTRTRSRRSSSTRPRSLATPPLTTSTAQCRRGRAGTS
jgi:choline dehydrogenase-like flavoprotein